MERRVSDLEQQQLQHAERLARLEATGDHVRSKVDEAAQLAATNGQRLARVEVGVKGLGRSLDGVRVALEAHQVGEAELVRQLAADVHVMRGTLEERQRHKEKHPLVRLALWVAHLFGYSPPGS